MKEVKYHKTDIYISLGTLEGGNVDTEHLDIYTVDNKLPNLTVPVDAIADFLQSGFNLLGEEGQRRFFANLFNINAKSFG